MNRKADQDREDPLLELICELDERLDEDLHGGSGGPQSSSLDSLSDDQRAELEEAEQALRLLQRMRRNLGILQELGGDLLDDETPDGELAGDSLAVADDSTLGGEKKNGQATTAHLPRTLGRFEILDVLGQGGFNRVFLARDPQLDRLVALKVPRPSAIADQSSRRRFEREALAAATLSHPAIVPIFETGAVGPVNYIAFGYCEGRTLAEWFADRNREIDCHEAARILARLCEAVEHAHRRGIVHRDLKPANILIETGSGLPATDSTMGELGHQAPQDSLGRGFPTRRGWPHSIAGKLRITDFGLAKNEWAQDDGVTVEGSIIGTPAYMAPEQARGEDSVSAAADIYALGTILYELLTGRRPFKKSTHLLTLRAVETEPPPPPRSIQPSIPRDLEAICLKCLRKSPAARYESAHDLATDLERWLDGVPVEARPVTAFESGVAWSRRNPLVAGALAFAFAALGIGLATALWQRNAAVANLREATRQTERAEKHLESAQAMILDIANLEEKLRHVDELSELRNQVVNRAAELQLDLMDREMETPELRFKSAQALKELSPLLLRLGEHDKAIQNISRVLALLEGIEHELPPDVQYRQVFAIRTGQRMNLANVYQDRGQFDKALALLQANAEEQLPSGLAPHLQAVLKAENLRTVAEVFRLKGAPEQTLETLSVALRGLVGNRRPEDRRGRWDYDLTECRLRTAMGQAHIQLEDYTTALQQLDAAEAKAAQLETSIAGSPHIKEAEANVWLHMSVAHSKLEQWEQSLSRAEKAHERFAFLHSLSPDFVAHPKAMLAARQKMVSALVELGRVAEAVEVSEAAAAEYDSFAELIQDDEAVNKMLVDIKALTEGRAQPL